MSSLHQFLVPAVLELFGTVSMLAIRLDSLLRALVLAGYDPTTMHLGYRPEGADEPAFVTYDLATLLIAEAELTSELSAARADEATLGVLIAVAPRQHAQLAITTGIDLTASSATAEDGSRWNAGFAPETRSGLLWLYDPQYWIPSLYYPAFSLSVGYQGAADIAGLALSGMTSVRK